MRILFYGMGSIGQRHLRNWKQLRGEQDTLLAFRHTKHRNLIENGEANAGRDLASELGFFSIESEEEAWEQPIDLVFVNNPTAMHTSTMRKALEHGCSVFVEKPIGATVEDLKYLKTIPATNRVMVGYQNRFHPVYKKLCEVLQSGEMGECLSARIAWGTWLPSHHPYEDYRLGYAALRNLGGGAVLGLSHDIDFFLSLWDRPDQIEGICGGNWSDLEMDVEDSIHALLSYTSLQRPLSVSLYLSYAQKLEEHQFVFQMSKGVICGDWEQMKLSLHPQHGPAKHYDFSNTWDRGSIFLKQTESMVQELIGESAWQGATLEDGIAALQLALDLKIRL